MTTAAAKVLAEKQAAKAKKYAAKPRALSERLKRREAEKLRRNRRNKRNARHG